MAIWTGPFVPNPEEDGVTHINVYSKGKTDLGRFLSNFTYAPMETEDGFWIIGSSMQDYCHIQRMEVLA